MKKTTIIVHQNYVEDLIKNLHETGMMEIVNISKEEQETLEFSQQTPIHHDAETCTIYELRLSRLIDILKKITPIKSGLKNLLHPELPEIKNIEDHSLDEIYSYTEGILAEIEKKILEREQKLQEFNERIKIIDRNLEQVDYLKNFELDISDISDSEYLTIKVGKISDLESIKVDLKDFERTALYSEQFGTGKEIEWVVVIVAYISEKDKIEKICKEKITEFDFEDLIGEPKELLKSLNNEKKEIEKEKEKIILDLRVFAKEQLNDLLALREEVQLERIRKEVSRNFAKTNSTYLIKGWVLEKNENTLKESIINVSKDHVLFNFETPSVNPDNPPIYLKTPEWAKPFRTFIDLFATPKYNELDPMIFMGIFFVLFFGLMLGDAGYGLVLLILSIFGYKKFSKYSEIIKNWSFMGIWLALVTIIVGFLTNSFFGDLIPRFFFHDLNQPLYSLTIGDINLPVDSLRNPLIFLMVALIFGLIQLNIGIMLAIYQSYRNKNFKLLILKHISWIPLEVGGGLLIGSLLLRFWTLGTLEFSISIVFVIIGLILRFKHTGPLGFFDITGYIGDWLSYARLLALGLATTGMALAFNIVAEIIPRMIPVLGVIFVPIILFITHTINLGLQTLGAGVHALRLQYIEFFNRFYEGGGKKFEPFSIKRKYTKIKEI